MRKSARPCLARHVGVARRVDGDPVPRVEVIRASEVIVVGHDNEYDTVSNFTTPEQIVLRLARPRPALEYTNTLAA